MSGKDANPVSTDVWSEALTSDQVSTSDDSQASGSSVSWLSPPKAPAYLVAVSAWVAAAIEADSQVIAWKRKNSRFLAEHGSRSIDELVAAAFEAEGGADMVAEVIAAADAQETRSRSGPAAVLDRTLPDGEQWRVSLRQTIALAPVVPFAAASETGTIRLTVLRGGRLGSLAALADSLAELYLVPSAEIITCLLTGKPPKVSGVRMGLRYRSVPVAGVPVSAMSRLVFEVDPQLDPAELARTFAQWQKASNVATTAGTPRLVALAEELLGKLTVEPDSGEESGAGHGRTWFPRPRTAWSRLARELHYDPRQIKRSAGAVIRMLIPLDAPHPPAWLPPPSK